MIQVVLSFQGVYHKVHVNLIKLTRQNVNVDVFEAMMY